MRIAIACMLCLVLSTSAYAQKSEERQKTEGLATLAFWGGIGVAAAGVTPLMAGYTKVGLPFVGAGAALIYYGVRLNNKAKQMPSTQFGVVPLKRGVAVGVHRFW